MVDKSFLKVLWLSTLLLLGFLPHAQAEYIINTVVGNGHFGYSGDGGIALAAQILRPYNIAVDNNGTLYIADMDNYRIRKVDTIGIITTFAGNGIKGFSGDDGMATAAQLGRVYGITVDHHGNVYLADFLEHRVRKIETTGIITTLAGNGQAGYSGDNGPAISAQLNQPQGITIDNEGNLYLADSGNHRIRKIDNYGIITTIAGDGSTEIIGTSITGPIYEGTYGGDGEPATTAQLNYPTDIAIDSLNNLYITDTNNNRLRKIDTSGIITTFLGDGSEEQLNHPTGITIDNHNNLYLADTKNHLIRKLDPQGLMTIIAGNGAQGYNSDKEPATLTKLNYPRGITVDRAGKIYLADSENHRIRQLNWIENLPSLETKAIDGLGNSVSTEARFFGGIAINNGKYLKEVEQQLPDLVNIMGKIIIDPKDVGKPGDIIVYASYKTSKEAEQETFYMLDQVGNILPWDGKPATLKSFQLDINLKSEQWVPMYSRSFLATGFLQIAFGYRLRTGMVITNAEYIEVTIR